MTKKNDTVFYKPTAKGDMWIPMYASSVQAGFPSPADDYIEASIDLNRELIKDPACTFLVRASGDSMVPDIFPGDLLVVDKSVEPYDGCVAVCFLDGEFTVKRLEFHKDRMVLIPSNDKFAPITVTEENNFLVWGVVRYAVKQIT